MKDSRRLYFVAGCALGVLMVCAAHLADLNHRHAATVVLLRDMRNDLRASASLARRLASLPVSLPVESKEDK